MVLISWLRFSKRPAAAHQLQVVHHHQTERLLPLGLQPPQLGVHIHQVRAGRVVDEQRRAHQLRRGHLQALPLLGIEIAGAEFLAVHARAGAQHAREQRLLRHFERKDGHRLIQLGRHVLGDIQGQGGLPHGRPRRQDDQLAGVHPAGHLVQLAEAGADALDPLARIEERVQAALVFVDDLSRSDQPGLDLRLAQLEQRLFGAGQNLRRLLVGVDAAVHQVLRGEDDLAQNRLVLDDADVAFDVERLRQPVVERDEVAQAVAGFELAAGHQFVGQRYAIDLLAALVDLGHAGEDAPVLLHAEVVGVERAGGLNEIGIVQEDGAEDKSFRVQIRGQTLFECHYRRRHYLDLHYVTLRRKRF